MVNKAEPSGGFIPPSPGDKKNELGSIQRATHSIAGRALTALQKPELSDLPERVIPAEQLQFEKILNQGDWPSILSTPHFMELALSSFESGKISDEQYATLSLIYAVKLDEILAQADNCYAVVAISRATDPEQFTALLQEGLNTNENGRIAPTSAPLISPEQLITFLEQIDKLPPSEQVIFLLQNEWFYGFGEEADFKTAVNPNQPTILDVLQKMRFNPLNRISEGRRLVASFSIYQALNQLLFGASTFKLKPIIGLSTRDSLIKDLKKGASHAALIVPAVDTPKQIDRLPALPSHVFYHDFYHTLCRGMCSKVHVQLFLTLAESLMDQARQIPSKKPGCEGLLQHIIGELIDVEFSFYPAPQNATEKSQNSAFWLSLSALIQNNFYDIDDPKNHARTGMIQVFYALAETLVACAPMIEQQLHTNIRETLPQLINEYRTVFGINIPVQFWAIVLNRLNKIA